MLIAAAAAVTEQVGDGGTTSDAGKGAKKAAAGAEAAPRASALHRQQASPRLQSRASAKGATAGDQHSRGVTEERCL